MKAQSNTTYNSLETTCAKCSWRSHTRIIGWYVLRITMLTLLDTYLCKVLAASIYGCIGIYVLTKFDWFHVLVGENVVASYVTTSWNSLWYDLSDLLVTLALVVRPKGKRQCSEGSERDVAIDPNVHCYGVMRFQLPVLVCADALPRLGGAYS